MRRKQRHDPAPEDFPPALKGGEEPDKNDHRLGETQRQNPRSDRIDPAAPGPQAEERTPTEVPPGLDRP
jgi:hypothetical protein